MKYTPEDLDTYKQIAICFYNLKNWHESLKYFKIYERYRPKDYSIAYHLGFIYEQLNDKKEAINYYEKSLTIQQDYKIYGNLARLYADVYIFGEREKQIYYVEKAYSLNPKDPVNILNRLLLYCRFNMVEQAKESWKEVYKLKPTAPVLFSYGCFLIHNKDFEDGFKLYRYRIEHDNDALPKGLKNIWQPEMELKDKTVLVSYEQGFGDTLMFIRFIKDFIPFCKKVKVLVQDELYDLLKSNFDFEIYPDRDKNIIEYDCFIPLLDIPLIINLKPETIHSKNGYLDVQIKENNLIKGNDYKIGICFEGGKDGVITCRDIPLEKLYPLFELPVQIYSFQKEDRNNQLIKLKEKYNCIDLSKTFNTFEDTASAMKQMDLIITTDNGVLNLAGSLGVKTFALFNKYPEFRWFSLDKDIGWYNIKPFQCPEFNEWDEPVERIIKELKQILNKYP